MSVPVDAAAMAVNVTARLNGGTDSEGIVHPGIDFQNGEISNAEVITQFCEALADEINNHTHDFDYTGAGQASSPQTGETGAN
ncbi:unnamed protein product [marine sediment metagenome]|uniref:Uncharacterized protein n=1 Tax=marine sediment metagenome TaxID=412755 RepID=X0U6L3_9ZZZZ